MSRRPKPAASFATLLLAGIVITVWLVQSRADGPPDEITATDMGLPPNVSSGEPPLPRQASPRDIEQALATVRRTWTDSIRPDARPAPVIFADLVREAVLIADIRIVSTSVHVIGEDGCLHRVTCTMVNAKVLRWWKPPDNHKNARPAWVQFDLPGDARRTTNGFYPRRDGRYLAFFQAWQGDSTSGALTTFPYLGADGWWSIDAREMARRAGNLYTWSTFGWNDSPPAPLRELYAAVRRALSHTRASASRLTR